MEAVSYAHSAKQAKRIKRFIENPDSNSGVLTQPKVIEAGETVTIKSGRQAILADTIIDGDLVIEAGADVFVPAGAVFSDLESQIALKADTSYVNDKYSGFKNYIINGGFDIWQKGTSGVSTGSPVGPDMWRVWAAAANTNWSQSSSADFAPFSKKVGWGLKWWGDTASIASPIEHRIESINAYKLSGKKLTLSFLAKCSSNTNMNIELSSANSIDNFTGATLVAQQGVSLTTTTQLFSITFDLTNTDIRYGCSLVFRPSVPSAIHWIAQVQLEEGSVATPFEQRPYGLELSLCQRYYNEVLASMEGACNAGNNTTHTCYFGTSMRTAPTIVEQNLGSVNVSAVYFVNTNNKRTSFKITAGASGQFGRDSTLKLSAEL